ncbi:MULTISPECIES: hypothetical protein [unclassified Rhodosalinus]|uniref:hypothetical protein n=1 Tax=unclassified Rhodosalinus TaxID=2630183 RepID=UPI003524D379
MADETSETTGLEAEIADIEKRLPEADETLREDLLLRLEDLVARLKAREFRAADEEEPDDLIEDRFDNLPV